MNVPSDWFSKKIFSLLSDDYVDSRKGDRHMGVSNNIHEYIAQFLL